MNSNISKKIIFLVILAFSFIILSHINVYAEEYSSITIGGNASGNVSEVNLVLNEHETETLTAKVLDSSYTEVKNPNVEWKSDNSTVVTVNSSSGELKALKAGTATITATASGVSDTCKITVHNDVVQTDFSKAKYKSTLNGTIETLQITDITPTDTNNYYYIITSTNKAPNIVKSKNGSLDTVTMKDIIQIFSVNKDAKYIYTRNISKYTELRQDLYLWAIEQIPLKTASYYDTNKNYVTNTTRLVVEGKKLDRAELPQLNLILQSFNIGSIDSKTSKENYSYIRFNFPTETENRKFTLKIGKITDSSILSKIKNNDYKGITELLSYAKSHSSIYSKALTTVSSAYYKNDTTLFDGNKLLNDKGYYYIYVQFDDENGKYYPIEGVTLGQAWLSSSSNSWNLYAYTSSNFKWDNLSPTDSSSKETTQKTKDNTTAKTILPYTGFNIILAFSIIGIIACGVIFYKKYNKFKGIK